MSGVSSILAHRFYEAEIQSDLNDEIDRHQAQVATAASGTLNLIAVGDSWFDYPLDGIMPDANTDVIAQLRKQMPVTILNLAHYGYTSTQVMGYSRQKRLRSALADTRNGKFEGILISAGGNDIAGDALCVWLNDVNDSATLNVPRFDAALTCIRASFLDLIALRDELLPGKKIFVHDYDFPQVTGQGVCFLGPWLKPSLDLCGYTNRVKAQFVVANMLTRYSLMLWSLANDPTNNLVLVPTQGTLNEDEWANELHPTPAGFAKIAAKFVHALQA